MQDLHQGDEASQPTNQQQTQYYTLAIMISLSSILLLLRAYNHFCTKKTRRAH